MVKVLPATSGPEKGSSVRAVRDQDLPGCPCRVTGQGAEKWRRQASKCSHVDSEDGRMWSWERGKKDEWGLSQAEAKANRKVLK